MMRLLSLLALIGVLTFPALAVEPDEMLKDPVLETRAQSIGKNLRCLVCQNNSIEESNADLAKDLRILVRERLLAGDSDQEVISFVVERYGDFVLLKPPLKAVTIALWAGPLLFLGLAGFAGYRFYRNAQRNRRKKQLLSPEDVKRIELVLKESEQ